MRRLPLNRTDRILLGILLAGAVVVTLVTQLLLPPARQGGFLQQRSSFINEAYGVKAAYLVLERLGCDVRRWRRPLAADALPSEARLVLLAPVIALADDETEALDAWVQAGGTLLLVPRGRYEARGPDAGPLDDWFKLATAKVDEAVAVRCRTPAADGLFAEVQRISTLADARFAEQDPLGGPLAGATFEVLLRDDAGVLAGRVAHGAGQVIALADAEPFSNLHLGLHDNAVLLANLLAADDAGLTERPVYFDEYHQGFPYRQSTGRALASLMWHGRWGWTVVQVLIASALALWAAGVRQGRARPSMIAPRRHHGEFAQHAAQLFSDGGVVDGVVRSLQEHYRGRAKRALRVGAGASDAALAQAMEEHAGAKHALAVAQLCSAEPPGITHSKDVLPAVERWESLLEELEHGG